jgi:hypothetical protein
MKKGTSRIVFILATVLMVVTLAGCSNPFAKTTYSAASSFSYSADKGHSYGDGTKEYAVGDTVYMKVKFKVTSNKSKTSQVKVTLSIPKVENVDAKYMDGQVITPNFDAANNVTTYEFTANASKDAGEQECVIQFVPNAVGSVTMTLVYDDNVDSSYDIQSTLEFVEADEKEVESESKED